MQLYCHYKLNLILNCYFGLNFTICLTIYIGQHPKYSDILEYNTIYCILTLVALLVFACDLTCVPAEGLVVQWSEPAG